MTAVYEVGNQQGRISVRLDREEALALAALYGPDDEQAWELLEAVRIAYPTLESEAA